MRKYLIQYVMLRVNVKSEAAEIAARVDVMVVVGDRKSANTQHLAEICRQNCSRVLQIESADELSAGRFCRLPCCRAYGRCIHTRGHH